MGAFAQADLAERQGPQGRAEFSFISTVYGVSRCGPKK
jgi:hypothetical protein